VNKNSIRRWLALLLAAVVAAALPAAARAQANPPFTWSGWNMEVDFPNQEPHVVWSVYWGVSDPDPRVVESVSYDISGDCVERNGTLGYNGQAAIFDGNVYLECLVPSWRAELGQLNAGLPAANSNTCVCQGSSPLIVHAQARLLNQSRTNPLFDASDLGVRVSLPSDGVRARTELRLSSGGHRSPAWNILPTENRVVLGQYGAAAVAVADELGLLDHLVDARWRTFYETRVTGTEIGHWEEVAGVGSGAEWAAMPYALKTHAATVYIGYNASTGARLAGELTRAIVDPGCKVN
jgi:hypothetical protein